MKSVLTMASIKMNQTHSAYFNICNILLYLTEQHQLYHFLQEIKDENWLIEKVKRTNK